MIKKRKVLSRFLDECYLIIGFILLVINIILLVSGIIVSAFYDSGHIHNLKLLSMIKYANDIRLVESFTAFFFIYCFAGIIYVILYKLIAFTYKAAKDAWSKFIVDMKEAEDGDDSYECKPKRKADKYTDD